MQFHLTILIHSLFNATTGLAKAAFRFTPFEVTALGWQVPPFASPAKGGIAMTCFTSFSATSHSVRKDFIPLERDFRTLFFSILFTS